MYRVRGKVASLVFGWKFVVYLRQLCAVLMETVATNPALLKCRLSTPNATAFQSYFALRLPVSDTFNLED